MAELAFRIEAWAAWEEGAEGRWHGGPSGASGIAAAPASDAPVILRRRIGEIGRNALRAAWGLPKVGDARFVFASRHGEPDRTVEILQALTSGDLPSPASFSLSVHNALAGLLSVASRNHRGHTALAAGVDSFCYGLLEAVGCLAEAPDEPVLLVAYDAPTPAPYDEFAALSAEPAMVLALLLSAAETAGAPAIALSLEATESGGQAQGAARSFLDFMLSGAPGGDYLGQRERWHWRHVQVH
ncbi:beta-ketoacyl synthase chain length factor [Reyranella sp. CPCC 100927]|uniref:beta-ketoacyl synthase chain length factor n=1 Tax=Reyranella sp. CPCC 100927 TaxID=2599616 RepID=UPI0015B5300B|nr:beta-ketoacyl synthase chain length factor [Reyranella sp. CPCC 100927]